jgi:cation-transporting P-type ATPase 13A2
MTRDKAETDLTFLGFVIFENKVKPSTNGVIEELRYAGIRQIMCTGDNVLTAISVAKDCNLMHRTAECFVPYFIEGFYCYSFCYQR